MKHPKTWLVIFDSVVCRIYDYNKRKQNHIPLIQEIKQPDNKLRDIDLTADRAGRYHGKGFTNGGTFSQESDPKERNIQRFAQQISKTLTRSFNNHEFEKLIVVAAPHMIGLLSKYLDKQVKKCIVHKVEKNAVQLNENKLTDYVHEVIWK